MRFRVKLDWNSWISLVLYGKGCFDPVQLNTGQIFVGKDRKEANKADILVRVCYRPSSKDKEGDEAVYKQLAEVMQSLSLVPVGDFNLPDLCCKCSTAQKNSRRCLDCVEDNFLAQLVRKPASESAPLDLLFTNTEDSWEMWWLEAVLGIVKMIEL